MNTALLIGLCIGVTILVLLAGAWLLDRLRREHAQLLARVESLEQGGAASPNTPNAAGPLISLQTQAPQRLAGQTESALKLGEPAPAATFLDISGRAGSLADFRGRDTTVIFWDGTSDACKQLLPGLRAVEGRPSGILPRLLLVVPASATGNQVVNLRSPVVIDRDSSFAQAFGVDRAPMAVLVDARGQIASELVAGSEQVLALANGGINHMRGLVAWAGLDFEVSRDTLTPRPETEALAERAVQLARERGARVVADVGTGSGVMAIFLARELPVARVYAVDISAGALAVAQRNVKRHQVADHVVLLQGSLLEPVPERPDLIVADLPYLSDELMAIDKSRVLFESRTALYGGPSGLELYAQLFRQLVARGWIVPLVLEVNPDQTEPMRKLLRAAFASGDVEVLPTYRGGARIVVFVPGETSNEDGTVAHVPVTANDGIGARFAGSDSRDR